MKRGPASAFAAFIAANCFGFGVLTLVPLGLPSRAEFIPELTRFVVGIMALWLGVVWTNLVRDMPE